MEFKRWLIRNVPKNSKFLLRVVPAGPVGRSGKWFEPDDDDPSHNNEPPDETWTSAMLSAGVEKTLSRAGRYFADLDIRPKVGGIAEVRMRVAGPDGSLVAERNASGVSTDTELAIFVYVG